MKKRIRELVSYDDPILRKVAEKVTLEELKQLSLTDGIILEMIHTMMHHSAVGIAAPQIGISKTIIVCLNKPDVIVLINPVITSKSSSKKTTEEGCLSCKETVRVTRPKFVRVKSIKLDGSTETNRFHKLLARQVQHEIDHLAGVLITDK